jgi:hypothetical protein
MKPGTLDIIKKLIALVALLCIIISLTIIIIAPRANGYEISIYTAYPWYFWLLIIVSIFFGQLIILLDIFYNSEDQNKRIWLIGIIAIIIPIIILIFMPYFRGYMTYGRGDHLTHIGIIKNILQTGMIDKEIFYPNLHFLTTSTILITGSDVISVCNFISRFFFFLFPISLYLLFRQFFKNKNLIKLALIIASSLLFFGSLSNYMAPWWQSVLLTPIILYLYFKRSNSKDSMSFSFLLIVVIASYVLYHPLNSILLILVFIFLTIIFYLYPILKIINVRESPNILLKEKSFNIAFFSILIFATWYFSFSYIIGNFYRVYSTIFHNTDISYIQSQMGMVNTYKPQIVDLIKIALFKYGVFLIITSTLFFYLIYILIRQLRKKEKLRLNFNIMFSGLFFFLFASIASLGILSNLIVEWERYAIWTYLFSFILITPLIYMSIINNKYEKNKFKFRSRAFRSIFLCIILIGLLISSIFTFYISPITRDYNHQVTAMEFQGMKWTLDHRNNKILIDQIGIEQWRFFDAIDYHKVSESETLRKSIRPPDHFNYNNKTSLGSNYNVYRYLVISYFGKIYYQQVYPDYKIKWKYGPEDFENLQNDNTVNRIYVNGEFEAYMIKPTNNQNNSFI